MAASPQVATYPGRDARKALELVDQQLQLSRELFLLRLVRHNGFLGTIWESPSLQRAERWHILDYQQAQLIACPVEQVSFDFDLPGISTDESRNALWVPGFLLHVS